jgi:hypothetical protein
MATVGEIIRVALHYSAPNTSDALNVFWYQLSDNDESDEDILDDLDTYFTSGWGTVWDDLASADWTMDFIEVDVINTDGTVSRNIGQALTPVTGTRAEDMEPSAVCGLLVADTSDPTKRGRKYVPGAGEDNIADGLWQSTAVTTLLALLAAYILDIPVGVSGVLTAGILSRVSSAFEGFVGSGQTTDVPAYQRRRKPNVGS